MIDFYGDINEESLKLQIQDNSEELKKYKNSYKKRIQLFNTYLNTMDKFDETIVEKYSLEKKELYKNIVLFQTQVGEIDNTLELLNDILRTINTSEQMNEIKKTISIYNKKYLEIKENFISNSLYDGQTTISYINCLSADLTKTYEKTIYEYEKRIEELLNKKNSTSVAETTSNKQNETNEKKNNELNVDESTRIEDNDTLVISEKLGKVILPFKAKEIMDILNSEGSGYLSAKDIIEHQFTRNLSEYKIQFASRYKEAMKLAREREDYGIIKSFVLSTKMMNKSFLHPAVISACKTLNQLNDYLECLGKNDLDNFKDFKVVYEFCPMTVS